MKVTVMSEKRSLVFNEKINRGDTRRTGWETVMTKKVGSFFARKK